jgi:hypothetical protein
MGRLGLSEIIVILLVLGVIPQIFYLLTMQRTLKAISIENRKIEPDQVWFSLIPLFGLIWNFIMIIRVTDSLQSEFKKRNIHTNEEKPGYSIGITYCTLFCCAIIPILGSIAAIAGFVCWIIYWVKINTFKTELETRESIERAGLQ